MALIAAFGYEDLPTFEGVWDPEAKTYASYTINGSLALTSDFIQQSGTFSIEAIAGEEGMWRLGIEGLQNQTPGTIMTLESLELILEGTDGQVVDPYALVNTFAGLGGQIGFDNPLALLGLLNSYSAEVFDPDLSLTLALNQGEFTDSTSQTSISLETASIALSKQGGGPNGAQVLSLGAKICKA